MTWLMDQAFAVNALREACAVEAGDDETGEALANETTFPEALTRAVREIREAEVMSAAIKAEVEALKARAKRYEERVERIKGGIMAAMEIAGQRTMPLPIGTVTLKAGCKSAHVFDSGALPAEFVRVRTTTEPNKVAIKIALEAGREVPGAVLSNGVPTVQIKV